jgi:hypothetical protein
MSVQDDGAGGPLSVLILQLYLHKLCDSLFGV